MARATRRRQVVFVGSKIRQLRKERGLTQAALAELIGVQQSDLCRMENGEYKVSLDTLFKILGTFRINIADFFRDEQDEHRASDADRELLRLFHALESETKVEVLDFLRYKALRRADGWKQS